MVLFEGFWGIDDKLISIVLSTSLSAFLAIFFYVLLSGLSDFLVSNLGSVSNEIFIC